MREKFEIAKIKILDNERERNGIGMLNEKSLHSILKHTIEPCISKHEVKIGRYYADIVNENGITEIQTRNFNSIRNKLSFLLQNSEVTLVYPIAHIKYLHWIDAVTGEVSKRRKSPKTGNFYQAFYELYKIKSLLPEPSLKIKLILIDVDEYRNLDGWSENKKKGSSRHEMIPNEIYDILDINSVEDYKKLIPTTIPCNFGSKDFMEHSGTNIRIARTALTVLKYLEQIKVVGKKGNSIIYEVC